MEARHTTAARKARQNRRNLCSSENCFLWPASVVVSLLLLAVIPPLAAETPSDAERLQKLEQAVSQLQKRNAELEQEVSGLKKRERLGACASAQKVKPRQR